MERGGKFESGPTTLRVSGLTPEEWVAIRALTELCFVRQFNFLRRGRETVKKGGSVMQGVSTLNLTGRTGVEGREHRR